MAAAGGFDFTAAMRQLCGDMVARVGRLGHIDMDRVGVSFRQTRAATRQGLFASLTPLRFPGGTLEAVRRGRRWAIPRVRDKAGREMLYILSFYLPRFLELPQREKLDTIAHELWHIGPLFDGDLRRHNGRCFAHGHSQKAYDAHAAALVDEWLAACPDESVWQFLRLGFRELADSHGRIFGSRFPVPKLIRLD